MAGEIFRGLGQGLREGTSIFAKGLSDIEEKKRRRQLDELARLKLTEDLASSRLGREQLQQRAEGQKAFTDIFRQRQQLGLLGPQETDIAFGEAVGPAAPGTEQLISEVGGMDRAKQLLGFRSPTQAAISLAPEGLSPEQLVGISQKESDAEMAFMAKLQSDKAKQDKELRDIEQKGFQNTTTLRKEFDNLSKDFNSVRDSFSRIVEVSKKPSAAGDLALIFNFMKMLDPGSVVRESEFKSAADAKGWLGRMDRDNNFVPNNVRTFINQAITGERLLDDQRNDFLFRAKDLFNAASSSQGELINRMTGIAQRNKLDTRDVIQPIPERLINFTPLKKTTREQITFRPPLVAPQSDLGFDPSTGVLE